MNYSGQQNINAFLQALGEKVFPKLWDILNTTIADWSYDYSNVEYFSNKVVMTLPAQKQARFGTLPRGTYQYEVTINSAASSSQMYYVVNGVETQIASFANASISGTISIPDNAEIKFYNGSSSAERTFTINKFTQLS